MGFSDTVATMGWTKAADITYMSEPYQAKIPLNMHIGCMGLAPASHAAVDSIPPMPSGAWTLRLCSFLVLPPHRRRKP